MSKSNNDNYCPACHVIGGYCGQCSGAFWTLGWQPTTKQTKKEKDK